ncbi:cysteine desulfurase [Candidatus Saccharibacteria bacterium]|nr:cysteine desulfurase [Candidatus Saccharibacteria bacterium]
MIYLDYASATPVSEKAIKAMWPYFNEDFFNPSAPYLAAKHVREDYEAAKAELAHIIGAKGDDLVITAGATEANNLAFSALDVIKTEHKNSQALVLETEHASVLELGKKYQAGLIKVDHTGLIDLVDLKRKLTGNTAFVSVALANNEIGTIQPLAEIAEIIRKERETRLITGNPIPLIFHSDASQALSLIPISVARLGVDLMTLNSAKVYGPKGVGALYQGHQVRLQPISAGGGQEKGLRSGTENVPGLIGFAAAAIEAKAHQNGARKRYESMAKILKAELEKSPVAPAFLGNKKHQLANFCPVSFPGIDAERIIYLLEEEEIYLSTGAACAASKGVKSHVLKAIGLNDAEIAGSLRISLGLQNTAEDMAVAGQRIVAAISKELARY